jgi:hypothetical protein
VLTAIREKPGKRGAVSTGHSYSFSLGIFEVNWDFCTATTTSRRNTQRKRVPILEHPSEYG